MVELFCDGLDEKIFIGKRCESLFLSWVLSEGSIRLFASMSRTRLGCSLVVVLIVAEI